MMPTATDIPWHAIRTLLDDPSEPVREALRTQLKEAGEEAVQQLRGWMGEPEPLGAVARQWLRELGLQEPAEVFEAFIQSHRYDLEGGSLLLARLFEPDLDPSDTWTFLEEVAGRARQLLSHPETAWQQCRTLNRVLFHEFGFRGAEGDFYNPENSFLPRVIERRRGIPISLSILYLLLAARIGLELEPIALPGRFMVGCFLDAEPFYIDVYAGGRFLTVEEVEIWLEQQGVEPQAAFFAPVTIGDVLQRCCRNLAQQYHRQGDEARAKEFAGYVRAFALANHSDD